MRGRIGVNQMMDGNDGVCEVLEASIEIQKEVNATPPEKQWLLPDRHLPAMLRNARRAGLAIGQKGNTLCLPR